MVLTNGEMKLISSKFKDDFAFSKVNFYKASDEEDKKIGIDFWLCDIPVAYRKYRENCRGTITIRYRRISGAKTECAKILEGSTKAKLFMFDFPDKLIFSSLESIKQALLRGQFKTYPNKDKMSELAAIDLENIKYIKWEKV